MTRPTPLRGRLPLISEERARLQTELIAALNCREVDGLVTTARIANTRDRRAATAWIDFMSAQGKVAVAPLLVDGMLAHLTRNAEPDGAAAAATLERIEPLVAAVETALGLELRPDGLSETVEEQGNLLFRLDGHAGQGIAHRLILAVPEALDPTPLPLPSRIPPSVARLRPAWTASIAGPAIPARRLETIRAGDLILIGIGPLFAKLSLPGRNTALRAQLGWPERRLVIEPDRGAVLDGINREDETDGLDWSSVTLSSVVEIEGRGYTASELAGIAEGSVLPLPVQGGTLAVRVRIGEQIFCAGELVAVGDGFGVLVTGLAEASQG